MRVSTGPLATTIATLAALAVLTLTACRDSADMLSPSAASTALDRQPPVKFPTRIIDIESGANHVCARTVAGTVYCWGDDTYGEIGVAATNICGQNLYGLTPCVPKPTAVTAPQFGAANKITAGDGHTCAITVGGTAWCWGLNWSGELGNGTSASTQTPTPVSGGPYTSISAGGVGTCGVSNTLVFCWGNVGAGIPVTSSPHLAVGNTGWSDAINVGSGDVCAKESSGLWACWGDNSTGQLGADHVTWPYFQGPLSLAAYSGATNVVSTWGYTCFDAPNTTIQCFGGNDGDRLGTSSSTVITTNPITVGAKLSLQLTGVAIGQVHACGLDAQGTAYCWGKDNYGELGRGAIAPDAYPIPAPVIGGYTFSKLVAGDRHTCGLTTDWRVICWGSNYTGQLGFLNTSAPHSNPPTQVVF
jgi:alpha-tubulin suppressor-like RCC1 family protein